MIETSCRIRCSQFPFVSQPASKSCIAIDSNVRFPTVIPLQYDIPRDVQALSDGCLLGGRLSSYWWLGRDIGLEAMTRVMAGKKQETEHPQVCGFWIKIATEIATETLSC